MRHVRPIFAVCAIATILGACTKPAAQPSVLLITLDTTRADHLGIYGSSKPTSPNLDRLAAGGTVFDLAISWILFRYTTSRHCTVWFSCLDH